MNNKPIPNSHSTKVNNVNSMTTNPAPSNNKLIHSLMKIALSVGVFIGSGMAYGFAQTAFYTKHQEHLVKSKVSLFAFSHAEYEQLKVGMTITDARSILGRGIEVSRTATKATYVWKNPDGSKITVIFEEDKLKSKEQYGLE